MLMHLSDDFPLALNACDDERVALQIIDLSFIRFRKSLVGSCDAAALPGDPLYPLRGPGL